MTPLCILSCMALTNHDDLTCVAYREFKFKGEVKMEISSLAQNQQRALCHYRSFLVLRNLISCRS